MKAFISKWPILIVGSRIPFSLQGLSLILPIDSAYMENFTKSSQYMHKNWFC